MMPPHPATLAEETLLAECQVVRTRRSGPGGQHRNKVETAVVITHLPTGVRGEASERRSQAENRRVAILRLRVKLAVAVRGQEGRGAPAAPSPLWQSRVTAGRHLHVNPGHPDFPALLAEALDMINASGADVSLAAEQLGVSTSQLVALLKREPTALQAVNTTRAQLAMRPLR
jgi:hypothetical protein